MILLNEPFTNLNFKNYVNNCLKTNWVSTNGKYISEFEKKLKKFTKSKYVNLLNSGTSALHLALKVIGTDNNTEILCPSMTFVATINAIIYNQGSPIFFDCDKHHNIDVLSVVDFIKKNTNFKNGFSFNKKTKKIIKGIIVVHMWGNVCDFSKLRNLCKKRNIKIIEDASESLGSSFLDGKIKKHTGTVGDLGCLSFNGNKIITSGSGGAILTNNKTYFEKVKYLSTQAKNDFLRFKHNELGFNYKMANLNAALGCSQMENLNFFIKKKKLIHSQYIKILNKKKYLNLIPSPKNHQNNYWLNILYIDKKYKLSPLQLHKKFASNKIETRMIWYPCHLQKYLKKFQTYNIKRTKKYFDRCICLPSGSALSLKKIKKICNFL